MAYTDSGSYIKSANSVAWRRLFQSMLQIKQQLDAQKPFDFLGHAKKGRVLFLGEGNFTFSLCLAMQAGNYAKNMTCSAFESRDFLSALANINIRKLKDRGARALYDVDATKLHQYFSQEIFDLIIFQFPNVASRIPVNGRNPNHVLIRKFLNSAAPHLSKSGKIAITVVNSPYYDGVFDMEGAAKVAGFKKPTAVPFYFDDYSGYTHVNTDDHNQSATDKESHFVTFVFSRWKSI